MNVVSRHFAPAHVSVGCRRAGLPAGIVVYSQCTGGR